MHKKNYANTLSSRSDRLKPFYLLAMSGLIVLSVSACGGGGGATSATTAEAVQVTVPPIGQKSVYQTVDTDNSMNTVSYQLESTVVSSSADGSVSRSRIGIGGNVLINGTRYGTINELDIYNTRHELVSTTNPVLAPTSSCTYDIPLAPLPSLPTGQAWPVSNSHKTCTDGSFTNTVLQNGSVIGIETVNVPEGVFTAKKIQYTLVAYRTVANGSVTTTTDKVVVWIDTVSGRTVQSTLDVTYDAPAGINGRLTHEEQKLLTFS